MASRDQSTASSEDVINPKAKKASVPPLQKAEASTFVLPRQLQLTPDPSDDEHDQSHSTKPFSAPVKTQTRHVRTETIYSNPEPRTSTPHDDANDSTDDEQTASPAASIISDRRAKTKHDDKREEKQKEEEDDVVYATVDQAAAVPRGDPLDELRRRKFILGDKFRAIHDFKGEEDDDLSIRKDEILQFIGRKDDDWWFFINDRNDRGLVPINFIEPCAVSATARPPLPQTVDSTRIADAWSRLGQIPSGSVASELGPLSRSTKYKIIDKFRPMTGSSNLFLTNLFWNYDEEHIVFEHVPFQKFIILEECLKVPKVRDDLKVLRRSLRICLSNESEIISNIHTVRAFCVEDSSTERNTEDWTFEKSGETSFIENQSKLLIRSNSNESSSPLFLIIELSRLCRSKTNKEECETTCGRLDIALDREDRDRILSLRRSESFDELMTGGHFNESNVPLDENRRKTKGSGLRAKIDRRKQARIKFKLENYDIDDDDDEKLPLSHLPATSIIIPKILIVPFAVYRNELAFQYRRGLETKPIDSIFLRTFPDALNRPDSLYSFLHRTRSIKKFEFQRIRKKYFQLYESFVYPLLCDVRLLEKGSTETRRKLIDEQIEIFLKKSRQENNFPDPAEIFLDRDATTNYKAFDIAELSYSLTKHINDKSK